MALSVKVAVIGAGASGLLVARELQREGHNNIVVYEKASRLGGLWLYDPRTESDPLSVDPNREIVHSSLYSSLRTNLPREVMDFSDFPFVVREDGDRRNFPRHEEVLKFLENFARDFGLVDLIRFNEEVVKIKQNDGDWVVESRNGGVYSKEMFKAVVVCNGHQTEPRLAELQGKMLPFT
ncbi:oxygenase [Lithospermum erythrorhizon]|uniref:Flavin-containing monooxygenase n=1 Tax=Lithospermum erythrorhizon TaxID=34254 RepID=A0AAV3Q800_LITER